MSSLRISLQRCSHVLTLYRCTTCNLDGFRCPGHCGHIELPVPVYHPTFMDQLLRLLRAQCQYCHGLKMPAATKHLYSCRLRLIHHGLLKEAAEIGDIEAPKVKGSNEEGEDVESEDSDAGTQDLIQKREAYVKRALKAAGFRSKGDGLDKRTEAVAEERRFVVKVRFCQLPRAQEAALEASPLWLNYF